MIKLSNRNKNQSHCAITKPFCQWKSE